jgi:DNA-binding NarL/FixJ family response regulator
MLVSEYVSLDKIIIIETQPQNLMQNIHIVIVEDQTDIREGLKYVMDYTDGYECTGTYGDAETAIIGIGNQQPDIVLMDIHLPQMTGIQCVSVLKKQFPKVQFLMFSIFENDENIFEALKAGASGYILKKTPPNKVLDAIRELFEGGSPMSASIARKVITHFQKPQSAVVQTLTTREIEILDLLSKGFFYKEISEKFGTTTGTVRQQIHKIYEKLHVQNRTEALNKYHGDT